MRSAFRCKNIFAVYLFEMLRKNLRSKNYEYNE